MFELLLKYMNFVRFDPVSDRFYKSGRVCNSLVVSIFLTSPLPFAWKGVAVFLSCWAVSVAALEVEFFYLFSANLN